MEGLEGFGTLTVIATDARTSEPLDATIVVDALDHPILKPRHTDHNNGRFDWLLEEGEHNITIKKFGYQSVSFENYQISGGERTVLEVSLEPMEICECEFVIAGFAGAIPIDARIILDDDDGNRLSDYFIPDGYSIVELPQFIYQATVLADGYLPHISTLQIANDSRQFVLMWPAGVIFSEDFDVFRDWEYGGDGENWGIVEFDGRSCLTESASGDYPTDADLWLELDEIIQLDTARATMRIIHMPYCEPLDDYQEISWWTNPDDVHTMVYSQLRKDWDTLYVSLDSLEAGMLNVQFRVVSDAAIGEDGWLIDQVVVFKEGRNEAVSDLISHPSSFILYPAYPNPFNSITTIRFTLPKPGLARLELFDPLGRRVRDLTPAGWYEAGENTLLFNGEGLSSGSYILKLEAGGEKLERVISLVK